MNRLNSDLNIFCEQVEKVMNYTNGSDLKNKPFKTQLMFIDYFKLVIENNLHHKNLKNKLGFQNTTDYDYSDINKFQEMN